MSEYKQHMTGNVQQVVAIMHAAGKPGPDFGQLYTVQNINTATHGSFKSIRNGSVADRQTDTVTHELKTRTR